MNGRRAGVVAIAGLLAWGCATRPPADAPVADAAPAAPDLAEIHRGLGPLETLWHLRAGLNVAALSCQGQGGAALVADYNALLQRERAILGQAYEAKVAAARAQAGAGWQRHLDEHMTRLYNHFAWPPAQPAFCREAGLVARAAQAPGDGGILGFAGPALARIDAPIVATARGAPFMASAAPVSGLGSGLGSGLTAARTARGRAAAPMALGAVPAGWKIQLGAFSGRGAAEAAWRSVKARSAAIGAFSPHFEPVPGQARLVRLRIGGLTDRGQAISLCAHAAAAGFDCIPVSG
jgi:cell division septation protein DedD